MRFLKQSTSVDVAVGPFLDETDGKTAETALTITQADIRLKKNGGAWAQKNAAQTLAHEENGWYEVTLDATDTNTLGILVVAIHEAGALPVWVEFMVVPANVYDSLFDTADKLEVDVAQWRGAQPSVLISGRVDANAQVVGDKTGYALSSAAIQAIWDALTSALTTAGSIGKLLTDNVNATIGSRSSHSAADVWAAATRTLTAFAFSVTVGTNNDKAGYALSAAGVQAIWDALTSAMTAAGSIGKRIADNLDAVVSAIKAKTDNLPADPADASDIAAATNAILSDTATLLARITAARAALLDELDPATAGKMAAEVDVLIGRLTAARAALLDNLASLDAAVSSRATPAQVNAEVDTALADAGVTSARTAKLDALPEGFAKNVAQSYTFLMVDATTGAPMTGLAVVAQRSIDGGAFAAAAGTVAEIGSGVYRFSGAAADWNGDDVTHKFTATGAKQRTVSFRTVS